jgi:hypothetical protein
MHARKVRIYNSVEWIAQFVKCAASSISKHVGNGKATHHVLVDCALDPENEPVAWFVVANGRPEKWDGWPSRTGDTSNELATVARGLGARFAFYGPINGSGEFEAEPHIPSSGSSMLPQPLLVRCKKYVKGRFAKGQALFLTGLALPLFHEGGPDVREN